MAALDPVRLAEVRAEAARVAEFWRLLRTDPTAALAALWGAA